MKKIFLFLTVLLMAGATQAQVVVSTFDDLSLPADSFWDGSDLSGGFTDGDAFFFNAFDTTSGYDFWSDGFAYSSKTDSTTAGYGNEYSAITAGGYNGSATYAVAQVYMNAKIILNNTAKGKLVNGFYVTNSTYAYLSMMNGDQFAKKFGGVTGNDPDWFKLTIKGWLNGNLVNDSVDFYLADFRFTDNSKDYIVRNWEWVNLGALGNVDSIQFFLSSSDTGPYGMNTPAYFCIDNFTCNQVNAPPVITTNNQTYSIQYDQDTLLNVLSSVFDTTALPLSLQVTYGPVIPGATAVSEGNGIFYSPAPGIIATDTLVYLVCDAGNLCDSATVLINVTGVTAVKNISLSEASIFPNPFTSSFTVQYSQPFNHYIIYDMQGSELKNITCSSTDKATINAADLPAGVYFIRLLCGDEPVMTRVVKQ